MLKTTLLKISALKNWIIAFYIMAVLLISLSAKAGLVEIESVEFYSGFLSIKGKSHTLCVQPLELQVAEQTDRSIVLQLKPDETCTGSFIEVPFHVALDLYAAKIPKGTYSVQFKDPTGESNLIYSNVDIVPAQPETNQLREATGYLQMTKGGIYQLVSDGQVISIYSEVIDLGSFVNQNVKVRYKESTHHVGPVFQVAMDPLPGNIESGSNGMLFFAISIKVL